MTGPAARILRDGRLHLQHGPIDLIIDAEGNRAAAMNAARARFETILSELVAELPELRTPMSPSTALPNGQTARQMHFATTPHNATFVTRMAAVAGAVADEILAAMLPCGVSRAYVNNGGDIALHLAPGSSYQTAMMAQDGAPLGRIALAYEDGARGIATSGWRGRSHSLGIADSVTVLARNAAAADVAATLIANAVDLPHHPAVTRMRADALSPDSDLGARLVVTGVGSLPRTDIDRALNQGLATARAMQQSGTLLAAALFLQGQARTVGHTALSLSRQQNRTPAYA